MSQIFTEPEVAQSKVYTGRWMVVIYNNDHNGMEEVILILISATQCDLREASIEAWEAHTFGKAPVHFAGKDECAEIAELISQIGVRTEVCQEWEE